MSHYTVLVVGDNVEDQLAPFHEFECTGYDDKYVQEISCLDRAKEAYDAYLTQRKKEKKKGRSRTFLAFVKDYYGSKPLVESRNLCDVDPQIDKYKYGWIIVDVKEVVDVVRRTNPNAKWDWYEVGGRWGGFFKLKPGVVSEADETEDIADRKANVEPPVRKVLDEALAGSDLKLIDGSKEKEPGTSNRCLKRNIDIQRMREEAANEAREYWRKVAEVTRSQTWRPWSEYLAKPDYEDHIELYRRMYWAQPPLARLKKSKLLGFFDKADEFHGITEEEYVEDAINGALSPYGFIRDYQWTAQGEMGWWGMSSDDMSSRQWNKKFREMFDDLADDTLLTLVDCHI